MNYLDATRFDRLTDAQILRRIGALLATAIVRSGRLRSQNAKVRDGLGTEPESRIDHLRLERKIADYLRITGAASPAELKRALGLRGRSLTRALARLRSGGLCEVAGRTRAARYRLRRDFTQN